ncbi:DUF5681 domain-containing protein [Desulfobacterota bacterium AH_259_B03_O07]|nr:DUF5681 domain-containing protein [Desulfobacterota bacterium AH_259_B03_O07]
MKKSSLINSGKTEKNLKPWKPGQSGNPKGRPRKEMSFTSLLKEAIEQKCPEDKKKRTWAQVMNEQLLKKAKKGDLQAMRLIYEYVEGKPRQEIESPSDINIHVRYTDKSERGRDMPL